MKKGILLLTLFLMVSYWGWGQTAVSYTGMGTITCPANPTATISPSVTGLTFSQITRGSGVTCSSISTGISGSSFNVTLANALTNNKWFTFSITSDATVTFVVNSLSIISQVSSAAGTPSVDIQYSIGSGAKTSIGSFTPTTSSATYNITPSTPISVGASQTINLFVVPNTLTTSGTTCRVTNGTNVTVTTTAAGGNSINTGVVSTSPFCVDASTAANGLVAYTTTGTFTSSVFTAKLSDASGSFTSAVDIGTATVSGTDPSGNVAVSIPSGTASGTGYKIRIDCSSPSVTGSLSSSFEIINGAKDVTSLAASILNGASAVSWTNPNACYDEIMIVAKQGSVVTAVPSGDGTFYNANLAFGSGDGFDGGYIVYKGTTSPETVTGLTNGNTYYYKFFTRKGTNWSAGATTSATPATASSPSDYFRSKATGNWNATGTWESSSDGTAWINATLTPDYNANTIAILNGHTVSIIANVTVDQVIIQTGGVLTQSSGTLTLNNGTGDDIIINNGGVFNLAATTLTFSTSATCLINTNGILRVSTSGMTGNGSGVNVANFIYGNGSILEYTLTSAFSSSGVTYFPNVDQNTIPIFRITSITATPGGTNPLVVNGKTEANISFSWAGNGTKTFRNGIIGTGTMSQGTTGQWIISGSTAEIGGSGSLVLGSNGISIPSGANVIATTNKTINGGPISIAGNLTINPGVNITSGNVTIVLKSDATGTGSLIESTGTVNATVERYIASDNKWHFLASPVAPVNICDGKFAPLAASFDGTTGPTYDFYKWSEPAVPGDLNWQNLKNADWSLNTADFGATPQFGIGTGYLVAYSGSYAGSVTKVFAGQLNTGDLNIPLSASVGGNKFNLAGNPYCSAFDWDFVTGKANLVDGYYFIYNGNSDTYEYYLDAAHKTAGANGKIPSMQGFFVEATGTSITVPNAARVHYNGWLKAAEAIPENKLRVELTDGTYSDDAYIMFEENGNKTKSWYDAGKLFSLNSLKPQVYTLKNDNQQVSFNSLPTDYHQESVPVSVAIPAEGSYTLNLSGFDSFSTIGNVVLEDLKTNVSQVVSQTPAYHFTGSPSDDSKRFVLHFSSTLGISDPAAKTSNGIYAYENNLYLVNPGKARLEVFNLTGQKLLTEEIDSPGLYKTTLYFPSAYYVVRLATGTTVVVRKVFIKS